MGLSEIVIPRGNSRDSEEQSLRVKTKGDRKKGSSHLMLSSFVAYFGKKRKRAAKTKR